MATTPAVSETIRKLYGAPTAIEHLENAAKALTAILADLANGRGQLANEELAALGHATRDVELARKLLLEARNYVLVLPDRGAREQALLRM